MSGINTNRTNITLPSEVSGEILAKTLESSAIMRLARRITLPGRGLTIPVITSDPTAAWVAETAEKPVSNPSLSTKLMTPYKIAVIVPFSREFLRDMRALYDELIRRLPYALGLTFDKTVIGATNAPGDNFDTFAACTAQSLIATSDASLYDGLVAAVTDVAEHNGALNGWALSPTAVGLLLGAVDNQGRPIFINNVAEGAVPMILGARTYSSKGLVKAGTAGSDGTPAIIGVGGDWTQAMYGTVEGVQVDVSDQATVTVGSGTSQEAINLWQRNMVAVRAEIEVGFRADTSVFNLLTGAVPTA
jgi:HK97 family phage major capsid protein